MYIFKIKMMMQTKTPDGYIVSGEYDGEIPEKGAILTTEDGKKYVFIATEVRRFNMIMINPIDEKDVPKIDMTLFLEGKN